MRKELRLKKSSYTKVPISFALKQAETGTPVAEAIRPMGVSKQTFYWWKNAYGGLGVGGLWRNKLLEDENCKLKQLVVDLSLDRRILRDVPKEKALTPGRRRESVARPGVQTGPSHGRCLTQATNLQAMLTGIVGVECDPTSANTPDDLNRYVQTLCGSAGGRLIDRLAAKAFSLGWGSRPIASAFGKSLGRLLQP